VINRLKAKQIASYLLHSVYRRAAGCMSYRGAGNDSWRTDTVARGPPRIPAAGGRS